MSTHALTIDDLERWVLSGAHWRVIDMSSRIRDSRHAYVHRRPNGARRVPRPSMIGYLRTAHPELVEGRDEALALDSSGPVDRMGVPPSLDAHGSPRQTSGTERE